LSHSSRDSRQAAAVKKWLIEQEPGLVDDRARLEPLPGQQLQLRQDSGERVSAIPVPPGSTPWATYQAPRRRPAVNARRQSRPPSAVTACATRRYAASRWCRCCRSAHARTPASWPAWERSS